LNKEKIAKATAFGIAGFGAGLLVGVPVTGLLGAIGIIKLAIAGTISAGAAVNLIKANYKFLAELGQENIFNCLNCGSSRLVKIEELIGQQRIEAISAKADRLITNIESSLEKSSKHINEKSKAINNRIRKKSNFRNSTDA
jgi:hypothetical protein